MWATVLTQTSTEHTNGWLSMSPLPRLHHHDIMTIVGLFSILTFVQLLCTVPRQSFFSHFYTEKKKMKNSIPWP